MEIVNYGSSKEKIDRGKIIRIDGFTFFETLLDKVTLTHGQIDAIIKGCLGTIGNGLDIQRLIPLWMLS